MIGDRCLRVAHHAFILFLVVATVAVLSAQTVVDPRFVEFSPSANHNTNDTDGTPLVQRYSLSVYPVGSSAAFDTMDLGKPTPSGGVIRVDFLPLLHSVPTPGVMFEARVTAIGPGGSTTSSLSNQFSFQGACTYTLSPGTLAIPVAGGPGLTDVLAPAGCAWTAVSNNTGWLTVTSGASGSGNGTVGFSVAANTGAARTGTVAIGGRTFTVNQAAAPCTYALGSTSQAFVAAGGTGSTAVTAPAGCAWTGVSNNTGWLTVTSGASGNGPGTVAFRATANPNTTARNGSITIAGQTFTVTQAAASCTYALGSTSQAFVAAGGTGSTAVTAPAGCAWTGVSNNTGWLTVTSGASGNGPGTVAFSATANPNTTARNGSITIAGQTFTVTQAAASCTYALGSTSQAFVAAGGTGSTAVTAPAGCAWTGVSNNTGWLTVTSGASGNGPGTVAFSATANPNTTARNGSITIAGQTFTVTQAAASCTYALGSTSQAFVAAGGTGSTAVTAPAGCAWTGVSNNTGWLTVTSGASGNGPGTVAFSATANPNTTARNGSITIAGQTFTVTQAAASCTYALGSTSQAFVAAGGTGSTAVTAPAGCAWTGVSNNTGWLTVTSGASGNGPGTVAFRATANPNTTARNGSITIAGQTFTVTQAAASCTYALGSTSQAFVAAGGTGSTAVTAPAGCAWTGVSNNTGWLTVTSGASGNGPGTVAFRATANPNTTARNGSITIAGQTFTVTQAAASCTYALGSTSQAFVAAGGTGSTAVTAPAGCAWTGVSNNTGWLTVTSGASGNGPGTVAFSATANPNTTARNGSITIAGQTFTVTQAAASCTYALGSTSQAFVAAGGTGSTAVTAPAGCAWTGVSNNTGWLTVTSGASGNGPGTVAFSATANPNTTARNGSITIAGQTFTVTQNPTSCTFSISPTSLEHAPFDGATGSSTVTTSDGCAWTATSDTSWITVTSGAQGTASGQVTFTVEPNTAPSQRLGSLTIAGRTFAVTQVGDTCNYVLTPPSQSIAAGSATGSTAVAAPAGCSWSGVSNNTGWLTVTSGASGTGDGSVTFSASANTGSNPRTGTLTVGGQTFTVTQAAAGCTFAISSNSASVVAAGATGSTTVTSDAGCAWSAASNDSWITVTSGASGSGNGPVGFSVAANPNTSARTGTLTIATRTFTVSQAASACSYSLTPTSRTVGSAAANTTTNVTTAPGCGWTAVSNATAWLAITGGASGSGNGTVSFSANTNTTTQARMGTATIAGQTFTVTQNAGSCTFSISPTSMQLAPFAGANGSSTVTTSNGCAWTATSNTSWITVTSGAQGTSSGQVTFTVAPSTVTSQRLGSLTIATRTFAVTQVGNTCSYTLSPANRAIGGEGGTGSITVTAASGCPWTATTSQSWISVSGTGTASGSASYTVSANTTGTSRTGSISIGTKSFTITQGVPTPVAPSGLRVGGGSE